MLNRVRWGIAAAGFLMQVTLGGVYAWSVFRTPLSERFGWSISQVTLTFTICVAVVGLTAMAGGLWLNRSGPRVVAVAGGSLYGLGVFLASLSANKLWWLYLSYGVIGGAGLGLAFIVPVVVLVRWFPDRRGLIIGIAVCGFGAGALATAPIATRLIASVGVLATFATLGIAYFVVTVATGLFMRDPPVGWQPPGWAPGAAQAAQPTADYTLLEALGTWQWWALWLLYFLDLSAGVAIISQEAPIFREIAHVSAMDAGVMVGVAGIGNAAGRVAWAAASDTLTRRWTFVLICLLQAALLWVMPGLAPASALTLATFVTLSCYGGSVGTMPAILADYFGPRHVGAIYGLILTAWGCASALGPLLMAHMREASGSYAAGLRAIACILAAATFVPLVLRPPQAKAA